MCCVFIIIGVIRAIISQYYVGFYRSLKINESLPCSTSAARVNSWRCLRTLMVLPGKAKPNMEIIKFLFYKLISFISIYLFVWFSSWYFPLWRTKGCKHQLVRAVPTFSMWFSVSGDFCFLSSVNYFAILSRVIHFISLHTLIAVVQTPLMSCSS